MFTMIYARGSTDVYILYIYTLHRCVCVCVQILHVTCVYIEPTAGTLERDGEGRGEKN